MSSTLGNNYVGAVGPNGFQIWRPTPYPLGAVQGSERSAAGGNTSGGGSTGGTTQPGSSDGNLQAQALFLVAACKASDAVGSLVRADAGASQVTTVTCFQPYPAIGCIISKSSTTSCIVQTYGISGAFSGLQANSRYFVGPEGQPVLASSLPSNAPYVQPIGFAVQGAQLFVQPSGILYRRDTSSPSQPSGGDAPGDTVSDYYGGLLHGAAEPQADLGNLNDSYLQTGDMPKLWGPKTADGWGAAGISLQGPTGRGNRFFWGDGPPSDDLGQMVDDAYIDRQTGTLYQAA